MNEKVVTLLLVEDNINDCEEFKNYVNSRTDVMFVGVTNSDIDGLNYIDKYSPDVIILDLELHNGTGNDTSFNLIETLNNRHAGKKPLIIVTTVVASSSVYNYLHKNGVDLIFYKNHKSYSVKNVIDTILLLNDYSVNSPSVTSIKHNNTDNLEEVITNKINTELNLIGVGLHLQGRKYVYDAIYYILTNDSATTSRISIIQFLGNKYQRSGSTISRAMQNAILHAWRMSSLEDLEKYYTAKINYETGVPTPTEFIYYYVEKIRKCI